MFVAFIAGEQIAHHAAQQGEPSFGDVQVVDNDLGVGDSRIVARIGQQLTAFFGHGMPVQDRAHAELQIEPFRLRRVAYLLEVLIAEGAKRRELEEYALEAQLGRQPEHADGIQTTVAGTIGFEAQFHGNPSTG